MPGDGGLNCRVSGLFCVYGGFSDGGRAGGGEGCRVGADSGFDAPGAVRVVQEILPDGIPALEPVILHSKPGACLVNDAERDGQVDNLPMREMPLPKIMSNSASLKGGATLFFTTLTLVRVPIWVLPSLMGSVRRTSRRTLA